MAIERFLPAAGVPVGRGIVVSPFNWIFTGEDKLELTTVCLAGALEVVAQGRMYTPEGEIVPFAFSHQTQGPPAYATTPHLVGLGALLNLTVFTTSAVPKRGQLFIRLQVVRGTSTARVVLGTLLQGYVTAQQALGWPGSPLESSLQGQGSIRSVAVGAGGLGAELSKVVDSFTRWRVLAFQGIFVADGTIVTRLPTLVIKDAAGTQLHRSANPGTVTAGQALNLHWATGTPLAALVNAQANLAGIGDQFVLTALMRVVTETGSIQPGDQWTSGRLLVEEWVDGD